MRNKDLKELEKKLGHYYCYFKSDDILTVSEDKAVLPFIHVIFDDSYPNYLLLSVAVDYPNAVKAVEVALWANQIKCAVLAEPFFISNNGPTYMGDAAYSQFELEEVLPLDQMTALSEAKH